MAKSKQVGTPAGKTASPFAKAPTPAAKTVDNVGKAADTSDAEAEKKPTKRFAIYQQGKCVGAVDATGPAEAEDKGRSEFGIPKGDLVTLTEIEQTQ